MKVDLLENCTCFNLRKAARAVTQAYDEALKLQGLRATQISILAMLSELGPVTMTNLADQLVMDRTTLTRNLKPLLSDNLVCFVIWDLGVTLPCSVSQFCLTILSSSLVCFVIWNLGVTDIFVLPSQSAGSGTLIPGMEWPEKPN